MWMNMNYYEIVLKLELWVILWGRWFWLALNFVIRRSDSAIAVGLWQRSFKTSNLPFKSELDIYAFYSFFRIYSYDDPALHITRKINFEIIQRNTQLSQSMQVGKTFFFFVFHSSFPQQQQIHFDKSIKCSIICLAKEVKMWVYMTYLLSVMYGYVYNNEYQISNNI